MINRPVTQIAVALIRQNDKILLVQQQGPNDPFPSWSLPGGVVERGELLNEALVREVQEEAGLAVTRIGSLLYMTQFDDQIEQRLSAAFIFEIMEWRGRLIIDDPDQRILGAHFLSITEAIEKLQCLPWRGMREPAVTYLRGEIEPGAVWLYRRRPDSNVELIQRIP